MHKFAVCAALAAGVWIGHAAEVKPAEQVYKNIVSFKGVPSDQVLPAMQFMATSLGVECGFCHVQGDNSSDQKGAKKMARQMIEMTANINKTAFNGTRQVTCFSCHHGAGRPASMPPVLESDAPARPEARPAAGSGAPANADQILEKYVTAMGGADAIRKVTSRVQKGVILAGGQETPIEVLTKAPNRRVSITHAQGGDSFTAFDGTAGWMGSTGRPARDMSEQESEASALDSEFYLALRLKEMFQQLRPGRPETVNGVECDTLTGTRPGKPPVRFYFDRNTGLLVRMVRYSETPLGRMPTQIDYADYRETNGVKTPFRWTLSRANGRFTIQIKEVQANAAIDDARFAKPAAQ